MKRSLEKVIMPDSPQMQQAVEAMRIYHEARDLGAPPAEVERLRILAESLFQAIIDYQLQVLGGPGYTSH
ncbi:hypothetical protein LOY46_16900 [Pseudomonas sichuanensis]|uniref:hypothetical protein n=1 Tax=Pseudomonas sichuanensis TaxID=2213015 RepID=UPI00215E1A0F|nr:hypothetical protein [Pseudomonas sichuanensis]UVK81246.1 hypothetical protein LOY46_16900 [Pseudomonas sichuanensis]